MTIAKHNMQLILFTWPSLCFTRYFFLTVASEAQYAVNMYTVGRVCTLLGIFS